MTKISDASLVAAATDGMKMPTGEVGDLAISVGQIKTNILTAAAALFDPAGAGPYWKVTGTTTISQNANISIDGEGGLIIDYDGSLYGGEKNPLLHRGDGTFAGDYALIYPSKYTSGIYTGKYVAGIDVKNGAVTGFVYIDHLFASLGIGSAKIEISDTAGISVVDSAALIGFRYNADYSANNTSNPRWIPDQARVEALILAAVEGLAWKTAVKAATTANITLSGAQTIDGVSIVAGDRVLVKDQSSLPENGIYICASGAWSRSSDANTAAELHNATLSVSQGSTNADTSWTQTTDNVTIGVSNIVFTQIGSVTPDATETTKGKAEIATQTETNTGTDDARFVTPLKLKNQNFLQALLVSGTNIKTVNGSSLLGSGDLLVGSRRILYKNHVQMGTGGATINETVVDSFLVAGGTMGANDALDIDLMFSKVNQNGTWQVYVYVHTSAALGGTLIATLNAGATIRYNRIFRTLWFRNSVAAQTVFNTAATTSNDDYLVGAAEKTGLTIDFSTDKYFVISIKPSSASDTCFLETSLFEIIRS